MAIKIFLSCIKEDSSKKLIEMIVNELKLHNYKIVNESSMFEQHDIEKNKKLIDSSDWMIIFMSKKSVERGSCCLRELEYAQRNKKIKEKILPILIEEKAEIPMGIVRTQWIPFTRTFKKGKLDDEYFKYKIEEIDRVLSGKVNKKLVHKVFISYGHDKYADILVKKIAKDLEKHGLKPWIDYDYLYGSSDWESKIEDGIDHASWVIFFITEHSMKRPDGYCLKEITYSRSKNKKIIPIAIQDIDVPISIIERPQIDFFNSIKGKKIIDHKKYDKNFKLICDILTEKILFKLDDNLRLALNPLDNTSDLKSNPAFSGREWLEQKYEEWLRDEKSKVFYLIGSAGSGKSQFVSHLSDKSPNIRAVHFCKYDDSERSNPKRILMSLAYHLAKQLPKYRELLLKELELNKNLMQKSVAYIFNLLFVDVLGNINYNPKEKGPIVIVIDALDETINESDGKNSGSMRNQLLKLITDNFRTSTPSWLKLLITSRPNMDVEARLKSLNPITVDSGSQQNIEDIRLYLEKELTPFIKEMTDNEKHKIIDTITNKSQGNFIYVSKVIEDLTQGIIKINDYEKFPNGLGEKYLQYFDRLFPNPNVYRKDFKSLLSILAAQYESLNRECIIKILNISKSKFSKLVKHLSSLFTYNNGILQPFHKSLIDYLSSNIPNYNIKKIDGHRLIGDYLYVLYKRGHVNDYAVKHLAEHCIEAYQVQRAFEILIDKNMLERKIKIMGAGAAMNQYFNEIYRLSCLDEFIALDIFNSSTFMDAFAKYRNILYDESLYIILNKCGFDKIIEKFDRIKNSLECLISCQYYLLSNDKLSLANSITYRSGARHFDPSKRQEVKDWTVEKKKYELRYPDIAIESHINKDIIALKSGQACLDKISEPDPLSILHTDSLPQNIINSLPYRVALAKWFKNYGDVMFYDVKIDNAAKYYLKSFKLLEECKTLTNDKNSIRSIESLIVEAKSSYYLCSIWNIDRCKKNKVLVEALKFINIYSNNPRYKAKFSTYMCLDMITHICLGNINYIKNFDYYSNITKNNDDVYALAFCYSLQCLINKEYDKANDCLKYVFKQVKTQNVWNFALLLTIKKILWNYSADYYKDQIYKWLSDKHSRWENLIEQSLAPYILKWIKFADAFIQKILRK